MHIRLHKPICLKISVNDDIYIDKKNGQNVAGSKLPQRAYCSRDFNDFKTIELKQNTG